MSSWNPIRTVTIKGASMKKFFPDSEKGSISVLIAMLVPILLLMVMLVLDIGQLVFEKIRLQNTVDASALVAANVQAVGLNEIADLNAELVQEHRKLKAILGKGIWYSSTEAKKAIRFYTTVTKNIEKYQQEVNSGYARLALVLAEKVKEDNLPGTSLRWIGKKNRLTSLKPNHELITYAYYTKTCSSFPVSPNYCPPGPVLLWSDPDDPAYIGHHNGSRTELRARRLRWVSVVNMLERYTKVGETYAWLEIRQNAKPFILGSKRFGDIPTLRAYAKVKPTAGNIYNYEPIYKPVMVR